MWKVQVKKRKTPCSKFHQKVTEFTYHLALRTFRGAPVLIQAYFHTCEGLRGRQWVKWNTLPVFHICTFLTLHAAQSHNQPWYIVHKQTRNAPAVKEWFFHFPALIFQYNCHRVMIRIIMAICLHFSLHLGQRGAHMGLVNGTWQDGGHCKGFITTMN